MNLISTMRKVLLVLTIALTASISLSCWHPPFDPDLSASQHTISRLSLASSFEVSGMSSSMSAPGVFIPARNAEPRDGVWLLMTGGAGGGNVMTSLFYLASQSEKASDLYKSWGGEFEGIQYGRPMVMMEAGIDAADPLYIRVLALKLPSWYAACFYESLTPRPSLKLQEDIIPIAEAKTMLGAGFSVQTSLIDNLFTVYFDAFGNEWVGATREVSTWPPVPGSELVSPLSLPSSLDPSTIDGPGFAAYQMGRYYLSLVDASGTSRTFCWPGSLSVAPTELTNLTDPLHSVLSDGTLITDDGMTMRTFDATGTPQYSFSSGSLRFIHERYDDTLGEYIAVFTRNYLVNSGGGLGTLRIEVFEIPTLRLKELAY